MYDSILTLLFLYKQLLKSCHAVSQTQGRTETDKQDVAFLLNYVSILGVVSIYDLYLIITDISGVWIWKLDYFMLGFLM